jgi:hypothetical protein
MWPAAACVLVLAGPVLASGSDPSLQKGDSGATARTQRAPEEPLPEAEPLVRRGLTRSGKYYVVATEQEFAEGWSKVRPLIDSMQAAWDAWEAAAQAEAQFQQLDATRIELADQIKAIRSEMATRDRLVRRWHQPDLDAAEANLKGVRAQLDEAKKGRVGPAKMKSLQDDFLNRKEEFLAATGDLEGLFKKLRAEYDALRKDEEVRGALRVLKEKKKLNVSLGPSDDVTNAARRVERVRRMVAPAMKAAQKSKKRTRSQERIGKQRGSLTTKEAVEP